MAILGTVLIALLAGVLDLGRLYFAYLALQDAAEEGAAYGSVHPLRWCADDAACPGKANANPNNITFRARSESPSGLITWDTAAVTVTAPNTAPGNPITVTMTYEYKLLTPVIGTIVGSQTLPLQATAVAVILSAGP